MEHDEQQTAIRMFLRDVDKELGIPRFTAENIRKISDRDFPHKVHVSIQDPRNGEYHFMEFAANQLSRPELGIVKAWCMQRMEKD